MSQPSWCHPPFERFELVDITASVMVPATRNRHSKQQLDSSREVPFTSSLSLLCVFMIKCESVAQERLACFLFCKQISQIASLELQSFHGSLGSNYVAAVLSQHLSTKITYSEKAVPPKMEKTNSLLKWHANANALLDCKSFTSMFNEIMCWNFWFLTVCEPIHGQVSLGKEIFDFKWDNSGWIKVMIIMEQSTEQVNAEV